MKKFERRNHMKVLTHIELKEVSSIRMSELVEYMGSMIASAWNDENMKNEYEEAMKKKEEKKI